jgi:hypothetical protein
MNGSSFRGNMPPVRLGVFGMPFKGPFLLGPFSVDAEGRLSPARQDVSPGFSVRWRGRVVHACLMQSNAGEGQLVIHTTLGRIPSTASDPAIRIACFSMLRSLLNALPAAWSVRLLPDHQPRLEVESVVSLPITVTNLVADLAVFLLLLSPYLDLMDQAGVEVLAAGREATVVHDRG